MPADVVLPVALITAAFTLFALVLAWQSFRAR